MEFGHYRNNSILNILSSNRHVPGAVRAALKAVLGDRCVDVEIEGVKFRAHPNQNGHDMMIALGTLFHEEKEEFNFMLAQLAGGGCLVDVGANTGSICVPLAKMTGARVIAVEPNPANVEKLRFNAGLNGLHDFTALTYAVGETGSAKLWLNKPSDSGVASLKKRRDCDAFIEVECRPLLWLLEKAEAEHVSVLKIDIEGCEDAALIPFFRDTPKSLWPKAVVVEHIFRSIWKADCISEMVNAGYRVTGITKYNTLLEL